MTLILFFIFTVSACSLKIGETNRTPASGPLVSLEEEYIPIAELAEFNPTDEITPQTRLTFSESFMRDAVKLTCDYGKESIRELKSMDNSRIIEELKLAITQLEQELKELKKIPRPENKPERRELRTAKAMLSTQIKTLKKWSKTLRPKVKMIQVLERLCSHTVTGSRPILKTIAHINQAVLLGASLPFRFLYYTGRGLVTNRSPRQNPLTLYQTMGPQKNFGKYFLTSLSSLAADIVLFNGGWFLPAISASVSIDFIASYQCIHGMNEFSDPSLKRFCENYFLIKKAFTNVALRGDDFANLIERKLIFRSRDVISERILNYSPKKKNRILSRVLTRFKVDFETVEGAKFYGKFASELEGDNLVQIYAVAENLSMLDVIPNVYDGIEVKKMSSEDFLAMRPADSEASPSEAEINQFDICAYIDGRRHQFGIERKIQLLEVYFRLMMNPEQLSSPEFKHYQVSSEKIIPAHQNILLGENVIFTVGHPVHLVDLFKSSPEYQELLIKKEKINEMLKFYKKLFRSGRNKCERLAKESNFQLSEFLKLKDEIGQNEMSSILMEQEQLAQSLSRVKADLKLNWKIIPTNHVAEVFDYIKNHSPQNIVIISHGIETGFIRDSSYNEFTRNFFKKIPPSVQSLNFYNCYSDKVGESYNLSDILKKEPSHYQMRLVGTVKETSVFEKGFLAPLAAFGSYLLTLDTHLFRLKMANQGALLEQTNGVEYSPISPTENQCSLKVENPSLQKGSIEFSLNGQIIGIYSTDYPTKKHFKFDCSLQGQEQNTLRASVITFKNEQGSLSSLKLKIVSPQQITELNGEAGLGNPRSILLLKY